jgi:uncharacterized protein (DUF305 family)
MRRSLVILVTTASVLVSLLAATATWGLIAGTGVFSTRSHSSMMSASPTPGPRGAGSMHGASATSEAEYLTHMVAHHREAVDAATQLRRSDRPEMRGLGRSIVRSQSAEMEQMGSWLDRWYPGRPGDDDYQPMMRDLSRLSGNALDRTFLEDMVGHHMEAVMTSQRLLAHGVAVHDDVRRLAESIRDEQHQEIFQMQRWLKEWFGAGIGHQPPHGMGIH